MLYLPAKSSPLATTAPQASPIRQKLHRYKAVGVLISLVFLCASTLVGSAGISAVPTARAVGVSHFAREFRTPETTLREHPVLGETPKPQTQDRVLANLLATSAEPHRSTAEDSLANLLRTPVASNGSIFYGVITRPTGNSSNDVRTIWRRDMSSGREQPVYVLPSRPPSGVHPYNYDISVRIAGDGSALMVIESSRIEQTLTTTLTLVNAATGKKKKIVTQVPFSSADFNVFSPAHTDLFVYTAPVLNSVAKNLTFVHATGNEAGVSQIIAKGIITSLSSAASGQFIAVAGVFSADFTISVLLVDTRTKQVQPISVALEAASEIIGTGWAGSSDAFLIAVTTLRKGRNGRFTNSLALQVYTSAGQFLHTTRLRGDPVVSSNSFIFHSFAFTGNAYLIDEGILVTFNQGKRVVTIFRLLSYNLQAGTPPQDLSAALSSELGRPLRTVSLVNLDNLLSLPNGVLSKIYLRLPSSNLQTFRVRRLGIFISTSGSSRKLFDETTSVIFTASRVSGLILLLIELQTRPSRIEERIWLSTAPDAPVRTIGHDAPLLESGIVFSPDGNAFAYLTTASTGLTLKLYRASSGTLAVLKTFTFPAPALVVLLAWLG